MTAAIPAILDFAAPTLLRMGASAGARELGQGIGDFFDDGETPPADDSGPDPAIAQLIDLGNGHRMRMDEEAFRALLHHPIVVDQIKTVAQNICDDANALARVDGARYVTWVQNFPDTTRARAFVRPGNRRAKFDDAMFSTMLKASAKYPSDPKPTGYE